MSPLTNLPNELQILILNKCPSVHAAVQLSEACRSLHDIWLENAEHIASEILQRQIPEYEDALELAKYESPAGASVSEWIPRVFCSAEIAQRMGDLWETYRSKKPADIQPHYAKSELVTKSYYRIRQLVNSYHDMALQAKMYTIVYSSSPAKEANSQRQLAQFMCWTMTIEETKRQGIAKDESLWNEEDKKYGFAVKEGWEFAVQVCDLVDYELENPRFSDPDFPCPWRFGDKCCGTDCRRGEDWPGYNRPATG